MDTATLSGTIVDQSGALVPGVAVTVIDQNTNVSRRTVSTGAGVYSFPGLKPGTYRVTVEREGFKRVVVRDIVINVQDSLNRNFILEVGGAAETIQVSGDAINVSTTGGSVGTVVDRNFVSKLPLNGRSFQSLILLSPGVVLTDSSTSTPGSFSVNGQRAASNYFTVDGVSASLYANQGYSMNGSAGLALSSAGGTNNLISVDALEEFKIQASTYSAEFGRQPGAQVSFVTRSGKNRFQGTVFGSIRNEALDAREYFNRTCTASGCTAAKKPPLRQHHFGGTFSGPVVIPGLYNGHDRTFFFYSYEDQRLRLPSSGMTYVPSLSLRQSAHANLKKIFDAFPLPNGSSTIGTNWTEYNYRLSDPVNMKATSLRLDHTFNSKLTVFARYNYSPSEALTHAATYLTTPYSNASLTRTLTVGITSAISSRLSNDLRLNASRIRSLMSYTSDPMDGALPIDLDSVLSFNGPGKKYTGITLNLNARSASLNLGTSFDVYQRQINIVDNVSWVKGAHQFKFGVDYRRLYPIYGPREYYQTWTFSTNANITAGKVNSGSVNSYPTATVIYENLSLFAQDTWKLTPRLTMDLGLRWELNPSPYEESGRKPVTLLGIVGRDVTGTYIAPPGTPFYKTFYNAFGPRLGLAYILDQTPGRETVLRGGFGIFHDLNSGQVARAFAFGFPNLSTKPIPSGTEVPIPPAIAQPAPMPVVGLPLGGAGYALNEDMKLPYSLQWNLALERALGAQQSLTVSYVASASRNLLMTQNLNGAAGYTFGGPRPNTNFQYIYYTQNGPTADYHSLQTQYKARFKRGLQALVNYTWAHAIDEVSNDVTGYDMDRSNATFDVRHNFSAAVTYDLPKLHSTGPLAEPVAQVVKTIVNNWSFDTVIHAKTGRPLDVIAAQAFVDEEGGMVTARPDAIPGVPWYIEDPAVPGGRRFNPDAFKFPPADDVYGSGKLPAQQGTFGRNQMRELSMYQIDIGLGRSFPLTETWKLQFKSEIYNVLNHPLFGSYNLTWAAGSTSFGVPTTTLNRRLGGLNRLYQMGGPRSIQFTLKLAF